MKEQILLVEDNPSDTDTTLDMLKKSGHELEVVVVHAGEAALDYLFARGDYRLRRAGLPSLILLDVKMPGMDGLDVLGQLRSNSALAHIPVLMLSSSRQEQDLLAAHEVKADGYLVKPLDAQKFEAALRTAHASPADRGTRV